MSSQTTQVRASCAFHAVFYSNSPPAVLGSAPPLSDSHPASPLQVGCSGMTSRSFSNNPHFVGFPGCSLLHGLTRWHWYVRNEASSCPGILSSTLRFYYVATSCLFPFLSSSLRVVLNRIPNRNRNRFCTSHTQCVTIWHSWRSQNVTISNLWPLLWMFFSFFSKTDLVMLWSQMLQIQMWLAQTFFGFYFQGNGSEWMKSSKTDL